MRSLLAVVVAAHLAVLGACGGGAPNLSALAPKDATGTATVPENSPVGTEVGQVPGALSVSGRYYVFTIEDGNAASAFALNPNTGKLTVKEPLALDHETTPSFTLKVKATDVSEPSLSAAATVTVSVTDVNEAGTVSGGPFTVAEHSAAGTAVGTVLATDPDVGQQQSFSITGGTGQGAFSVNSAGVISVSNPAALNFEGATNLTLTVRTTDNGSPAQSASGTVTINLTNVNEAPAVDAGLVTLPEHSPVDAPVFTASFRDPDSAQAHLFSLVGGNDAGVFSIDPTSGLISVFDPGPLNFEGGVTTYHLVVQVADNGTPPLTGTGVLQVVLTDVNEAPQVSGGPFSIPENSTSGTAVGVVVAADPDTGQTLAYSITAGNTGGAFALNASTGELTVASSAALNFESSPSFSLTVRVTDSAALNPLSNTATVVVNLTNANDAPTVTPGTFSAAENTPNGSSLGTVVASDPDLGQTATLAYAITAGNTGGAFGLDGGALLVANSGQLNFEGGTTSYSLTVQATDTGGLSGSASVTVNVTNVNEAPAVAGATFSVAELAANNTVVGTAPGSDPDTGQTATLRYAIDGGNTGGVFTINALNGQLTVANGAGLDFETTPSYGLSITAQDTGGLIGRGLLTVNLTNANDRPSFSGGPFSVAENSDAGTVVGQLVGVDQDSNDTLTFSVSGGSGAGLMAVNASTGQVTLTGELDFEVQSSYVLNVTVTDSAAASFSQGVTVSVTNANDRPTLDGGEFFVAPSAAPGTVVATLMARDQDLGQTHTYALQEGSGSFTINPATGAVSTTASAALVAGQSYPATATATDNGSPAQTSLLANLTIWVGAARAPQSGASQRDGVPQGQPATFLLTVDRGLPTGSVTEFTPLPSGTPLAAGSAHSVDGGTIRLNAQGQVEVGGSLAPGAYRFSYRMVNSVDAGVGSFLVLSCPRLAVGESYFASGAGLADFCVGGEGTVSEFVVVPMNSAATGDLPLSFLSQDAVAVVGPPSPNLEPGGFGGPPENDGFAAQWEANLRREDRLLRGQQTVGFLPQSARYAITPGTPTVGQTWQLNVAPGCTGTPDDRTGVVLAVSQHAVVVADTANPDGGLLPESDSPPPERSALLLAQDFDARIWPTLTANFGGATDVDSNGQGPGLERVVLFFSSSVNALTPNGASSRVSGYFTARDRFLADTTCPRSNEGELLYLETADPDGTINGNVRTMAQVRADFGRTAAHELQHLLNAFRRPGTAFLEESWLDEGLSHLAEELVFRAQAGLLATPENIDRTPLMGAASAPYLAFQDSNLERLRAWLLSPTTSGPYQPEDQDLATRGSAWALVRYLADRHAPTNPQPFYTALATGSLTGMANLAQVLGTDPLPLVHDFAVAQYTDDAVSGVATKFLQPSWNFRDVFEWRAFAGVPAYPLVVRNQQNTVDNFTLANGGGTAFLLVGSEAGRPVEVQVRQSGGVPAADAWGTVVRRR